MARNIKNKQELSMIFNKTVISPVVTYACEIWTLAQKDEPKLAVFERKILRKIFGPLWDESGAGPVDQRRIFSVTCESTTAEIGRTLTQNGGHPSCEHSLRSDSTAEKTIRQTQKELDEMCRGILRRLGQLTDWKRTAKHRA